MGLSIASIFSYLICVDEKKYKAAQIIDRLNSFYHEEVSFLDFNSPFQLLIGVILSARTTDRQVNKLTPRLFARFPDPKSLSGADISELEEIVRPAGFFKSKAAHIKQSAALLYGDYNDVVPSAFEDLLRFEGIGRKSANVIRHHVFNLPSLIVDTHFSRVAGRLGLVSSKNPEAIEDEVRDIVEPGSQSSFSMRANRLGREYCRGQKPLCGDCPLRDLCDYNKKSVSR